MRINLQKAKTRTRFSRESLLLKRINRVCRFDGFFEIWSEHSLIDIAQKRVGDLSYFKYFPRGGL